jgi:hypothetical protein
MKNNKKQTFLFLCFSFVICSEDSNKINKIKPWGLALVSSHSSATVASHVTDIHNMGHPGVIKMCERMKPDLTR